MSTTRYRMSSDRMSESLKRALRLVLKL
jgi:hypothetical protein